MSPRRLKIFPGVEIHSKASNSLGSATGLEIPRGKKINLTPGIGENLLIKGEERGNGGFKEGGQTFRGF